MKIIDSIGESPSTNTLSVVSVIFT